MYGDKNYMLTKLYNYLSNPSGYTGTDMPIGGYKVTSDNGAVATNTSDDSGAGSNF